MLWREVQIRLLNNISGVLRSANCFKRFLIVWGDHSSILSHGVLLYTVKAIYSTTIFYTDDEMLKNFGVVMDVQSVVEQPQIYIFAHCSDSIAEKLSYIPICREDVLKLRMPMHFGDVVVEDVMRFFIGELLHISVSA